MPKFANRTVLITGASSGIGAALAREFGSEGASLVLLARRVELMEQVAQPLRAAGAQVAVYRCDITQADQLQVVIEDLSKRGIGLDIVIANAGFGVMGRFDQLSLADYQRQFDSNVFGVLRTAYATLDELRRRRGTLVIMGSIVSHVAQPGGSAYAMSKFAIRAFAEALRVELMPVGVGVTLLSPGVINSNLRRVDNQGIFHAAASDPLPRWLRMSTEQAARQMVRAIHARKHEQIITLHGRVIVFLARHMPWLLRWTFRFGLRARSQPGQ